MPKKRVKIQKNPDATPIRDWIYGGLLVVVVAIMPIVVRFAIVTSPPELFAMYPEAPAKVDFFSYYKGWLLGIPTMLILIYALLELFTDGFANVNFKALLKSPVIIASGIFLLMVILSTLLSSYRHTSWHGTIDRGEGLWILFAYKIIFITTMFYVRKEKHIKYIMYGLAFSSIIMGIVGFSQFIERDIFETGFGQWFLRLGMSPAVREQVIYQEELVTALFEFSYGTLYNPNTFGKYTAMAAPILLTLALVFDEKGWKGLCGRIAFLLGGGLMLVGVFGSRSLGGFVAIGAATGAIILAVICRFFYQMRKRKREEAVEAGISSRPWLGWAIGIAAAGTVAIALIFVPVINERLSLVTTRFEEALRSERRPMDDMVFDGNSFTYIRGGYERFTLVLEGEWEESEEPNIGLPPGDVMRIYDGNGLYVPITSRTHRAEPEEHYEYVFAVPDFGNVSILLLDDGIIFRNIIMLLVEDHIYTVAANFDFIDMRERVPSTGFYGREHWGSNRGYIWSRTFPLLPSRTIIGSGPDTFTVVFPQNDIVPKAFLFGNPHIQVDKAHNIYLQTWVTTGGISALAQIFLFGLYLFIAFLQIVRSDRTEGTFLFGLQIGLFAGISAFVIGALSTDSTIGSSGVFYLLLGLGYGVVFMVKKMQKPDVINQDSEIKRQRSDAK